MKSKQDLRYLISNDKTGSCIERQFQFFGLNQTIQLTFDVHFFKTGQESWTLTAETGRRIHSNPFEYKRFRKMLLLWYGEHKTKSRDKAD